MVILLFCTLLTHYVTHGNLDVRGIDPTDLKLLAHYVTHKNLDVPDIDPTDLRRAYQPRPLPDSHVAGTNGKNIFSAMNLHLTKQPIVTAPCEEYDHTSLNNIARQLFPLQDKRLHNIYTRRNDRRALHFDNIIYKEKLWEKEKEMILVEPETYGVGSIAYNMTRDGKCAELVMWWVHHLPISAKNILKSTVGFKLPLMPKDGPAKTDHRTGEYVYQVTCDSCHRNTTASANNATNHSPPRYRLKNMTQCPKDPKTGLPTVWYEPVASVGHRKKRCDWDYDPPCQMCESVGGIVWGDQEHEITYTSCIPLQKPSDIPKNNITSPIWPFAFTVDEYAIMITQINEGGQFPGADPCAPHKYTNNTEVLYYNQTQGMRYKTKSGSQSTDIWHLVNGNMYIKIDGAYCICVSVFENGDKKKPPMGPLVHDYAKDAVLIGREKITVEYIEKTVVADHWNKGPHHFWIEVETNQMIRAWQPFNGLNVYSNWNYTEPVPQFFKVDPSCYTGVLHKNISCVAPPPTE